MGDWTQLYLYLKHQNIYFFNHSSSMYESPGSDLERLSVRFCWTNYHWYTLDNVKININLIICLSYCYKSFFKESTLFPYSKPSAVLIFCCVIWVEIILLLGEITDRRKLNPKWVCATINLVESISPITLNE